MKKIQYLKTASYMVPFVDVFILAIEKKKQKSKISESQHTFFYYAVISIGIFTKTRFFPYKTESFTLSF